MMLAACMLHANVCVDKILAFKTMKFYSGWIIDQCRLLCNVISF